MLHGSRARGDAHALSDWDFAYEADATFDPDALLARLSEHLGADRIDLADLERFERFWLKAVDTWCDLAPILEPAYEEVLGSLPR